MNKHLYNTNELIEISGLKSSKLAYLKRLKLLVHQVSRPVKWNYESILLAKVINTLEELMTPQLTIAYISELLTGNSTNWFINTFCNKPFLMLCTDEIRYYAITYNFEDDLINELNLVNRFNESNSNILLFTKGVKITNPSLETLRIPNLYAIYIERLKQEIDFKIENLYSDQLASVR